MKKFKKIIMLVVTFFSLSILLCGCSQVSFLIVQSSNGQVAQTLQVELNQEKMEQYSVDYNVFSQKVKLVLQNVFLEQKQRFFDREDVSDVVKNQVWEDVKTSVTKVNNTIRAEISFKNATDYNLFYGIDTSQSSAQTFVKQGVFYNVVTTKTFTKFYNYQQDPIYQNAINELMQDLPQEFADEQENISYLYCYAVPSNSKLKSNANYVYSTNGFAVHAWKVEANELDKQIEFYQILVKPVAWYVLAIVLTLILLIILIAIILIKHLLTKNKQTTTNQMLEENVLEQQNNVNNEQQNGNNNEQ